MEEKADGMLFHSENFQALSLMQARYREKVNCIYIDPPYNTGNDFVYPDNYREGLATYLEWTRQINEEGNKKDY